MSDPTGEPIADRPDDTAAPSAAAPNAAAPAAAAPDAAPAAPDAAPSPAEPGAPERRPALERIGLAAIAVVMAVLFGGVAVAAFAGGEYFLAAMSAVGCMMTLVVGGSTLLRG